LRRSRACCHHQPWIQISDPYRLSKSLRWFDHHYSIDNFFSHFEGFFQHGIFHGITILQESKLLKIRDKKGLLIIEWE